LAKTLCIILAALFFVLNGLAARAAADKNVVIVELSGEIDRGQAALVLRGLELAKEKNAAAFILQMDTFGGLVESATNIRDKIIESAIPTVCYVKNRAWSAGALIALAHGRIVMAPGGSIGAAEPIPATEKTIAAVKAEFAATAKQTGRDPQIAQAMVDKTLGYKEYAQKGQILALTDYQAVKEGLADFVAQDRAQLLQLLKLEDCAIEVVSKSWRETFVSIIETPAAKSALLSIIIFAIIAEVKTAGLGVGAAVAAFGALLLFGGGFVVGISGWLEPLLFLLGIVLLIIEAFIPGFGVFGISGIIAVAASFFLILGGNQNALVWLAVSITAAIILFLLLLRRLPSSTLWNRVILKNTSSRENGFSAGPNYENYLGREGVSVTQLHPGGAAAIGGEKFDVLTQGEFIGAGERIVVTKTEGSKLFVKKA
jgi:membrane-bound serine protease (ClpP class)